MNNLYGTREIFTLKGDAMCYDNKAMSAAHSERSLAQPAAATTVVNLGDPSTTTTTTPSNTHRHKNTLRKLRRRLRTKNLIDIVIIVVVATLMGLIELGYIPNTKLGYICDDPKISYPFRGDTISATFLLTSSFFGSFFVIILVEILRENCLVQKVRVSTIWLYYKELLIGSTLVLLVTEVAKVLVGEHRPHFLDSCRPNRNCNPGEFILDYNCTNQHLGFYFRTDVMRSFPSGHTSISVFMALYCSYLIHSRIHASSVSKLTKPFFISVCLTYSLVCSLTRITDRRHHWWDVLAGAILGVCGVVYSVHCLRKMEHVKGAKSDSCKMGCGGRQTNISTTTLVDVKNKDATSVVI